MTAGSDLASVRQALLRLVARLADRLFEPTPDALRAEEVAGAYDVLRVDGWPQLEVELVVLGHLDALGQLGDAFQDLRAGVPELGHRIFPAGAIWVAWPRRAGGHESDIREQDIRDLALPLGLVDVKVAALDEDWSGLRLVWRKEHREGPLPSSG